MKFIFPQNYNFNNKLFGVFDYTTIIFNIVWDILVLFLLNLIINSINIKILLFIIFCFPLLLFSILGFNGENILYIFSYIIKFLIKNKLIFYK